MCTAGRPKELEATVRGVRLLKVAVTVGAVCGAWVQAYAGDSPSSACGTKDTHELRLHVVNEAGAAAESIDVAMAQATEIWARLGVRLTWTFPPTPLRMED